MSFTRSDDGFYHIPIIALGERLRDNFGLTIKEHSHFDTVDDVHAPNSYHDYDEALDIQDWRDDVIDGVGWRERTGNLERLLAGSGAEIFGPNSGVAGHDTHLHIAAKSGMFKLNQQQYDTLFGGEAGGRNATFASFKSPATPQKPDGTIVTPPAERSDEPIQAHVDAKTKAKAYKDMNKIEMNAAYDALRASDPAKAAIEGKKMHRAFFGK